MTSPLQSQFSSGDRLYFGLPLTRKRGRFEIHEGPLPKGGEGMRVSGSERWCSLTHKAVLLDQREETPHQPPAPYSRGARECAPHQFSSDRAIVRKPRSGSGSSALQIVAEPEQRGNSGKPVRARRGLVKAGRHNDRQGAVRFDFTRSGAARLARQPHKLKVIGSNPISATKYPRGVWYDSQGPQRKARRRFGADERSLVVLSTRLTASFRVTGNTKTEIPNCGYDFLRPLTRKKASAGLTHSVRRVG